MNYLKKIEQFFRQKEKLLEQKLDFIKAQYIQQFQDEKDKFFKSILQDNQQTDENENIKDLKIKFTDYFRNRMRKLQTVLDSNQQSMDLINNIIKANQQYLQKHNILNLKKQFDEICKYDEKTNTQMNYYKDPVFCSYLISKTYKKTFKELNEFLFYSLDIEKVKQKKFIKICAIGGGSGNDALALYYTLKQKIDVIQFKEIQFHIQILDLNYEAWQLTTQNFYMQFFKNSNIKFSWEKIDHSQDLHEKNYEADYITACWTLNESNTFQKLFWKNFIQNNQNAIYCFIEGEQTRLDIICQLLKERQKQIYYERFSSPRKLIAI